MFCSNLNTRSEQELKGIKQQKPFRADSAMSMEQWCSRQYITYSESSSIPKLNLHHLQGNKVAQHLQELCTSALMGVVFRYYYYYYNNIAFCP